jgi:hypothetical protein
MMYSLADGMAYVSALKAEFSGFKSQAGDRPGWLHREAEVQCSEIMAYIAGHVTTVKSQGV